MEKFIVVSLMTESMEIMHETFDSLADAKSYLKDRFETALVEDGDVEDSHIYSDGMEAYIVGNYEYTWKIIKVS